MQKESLNLQLISKAENKHNFIIENKDKEIKGILKIVKPKLKDYLQIIINFNNYYEEKYSLENIKSMECFKYSPEENLDDIYISIIDFINKNKYEIYDEKYGDIFTISFNDEIRRKKLSSTFKLIFKETLENNEMINDLLKYFSPKKDIDNDKKNEIKKDDSDKLKNNVNNIFNFNNNNGIKLTEGKYNDIIDGSSLLLPDHINSFKEWFYSKFILKKIYDSDKDGKTPKEFHNKCDRIENVLVLIESNYGKLFGGFSTCEINSYYCELFGDNQKDFLFSLSEKRIFRVRYLYGGSLNISIFNSSIFSHSNQSLLKIYLFCVVAVMLFIKLLLLLLCDDGDSFEVALLFVMSELLFVAAKLLFSVL